MLFQMLDLRGLPADAEVKLLPDRAVVTLPGQEPLVYEGRASVLLDADLPRVNVSPEDMADVHVQIG